MDSGSIKTGIGDESECRVYKALLQRIHRDFHLKHPRLKPKILKKIREIAAF